MKNVTFLQIDFPVSTMPRHIRHFFVNAIDGYAYIQKKDNDVYEFRHVIYGEKDRKDNDVLIEVINESVAYNIIEYVNACNKKIQQKRVEKDIKLKLTIDDIQNWLNTLPSNIAGLTRVDDVLVDEHHNVLFNLLDRDLIFEPYFRLNDIIEFMMEQEDNGIGD